MDVVNRHLVYLYLLNSLMTLQVENSFYKCNCRDIPATTLSKRLNPDHTISLVESHGHFGHCLHDKIVPLLYERDAQDIRKQWGWDEAEMTRRMVRSNPSRIFWLFILEQLSRAFDLFRTPGFYFWQGLWRIQISPDIHFLLPRRDENNLITGIYLYRYANEQRPQMLTSHGLPFGAKAENL